MQLSIASLVLLSTLVGVFSEPEPQFEGYGHHQSPYIYIPSFRDYPPQAHRPQLQSPAPRLYLVTISTTVSFIPSTCVYSTAVLGACGGRKRRAITADDDAIEASPIQRVMATQVAEMDDVRHKRQFLREDFSYDPSAIASSQYYDEPKVTHYLNVKDGSRFLFRRTYTSTVYSTLQVRILVTCAGVHPAAC